METTRIRINPHRTELEQEEKKRTFSLQVCTLGQKQTIMRRTVITFLARKSQVVLSGLPADTTMTHRVFGVPSGSFGLSLPPFLFFHPIFLGIGRHVVDVNCLFFICLLWLDGRAQV
ncbi:hypothetical protein CEXT_780701 [Caerostris extrusa]|uniref:Uncharacterized protein n=1 Tax=Caerostris extrusa TaxID=172846 RepID=A0AAV4TN42_CAEEX|nr:hypothetical protein CEXT_780701 [Caerostris extrusa]